MAITIKSIKCPQCGSTKKRNLKDRYYICENCETEYVISDPNAPQMHHHVHVVKAHEPPIKQAQPIPVKALVFVIGLVVISFVLLTFLLPSKRTVLSQSHGFNYSSIGSASGLFENAEKKAIFIQVGDSKKKAQEMADQEVAVDFYWLDTLRKIKTQILTVRTVDSSVRPEIATFSNGDIYLTVNKRNAFRLDHNTVEFISINEEIIQQHTEQLAVGIAEIEVDNSKYHPKPDRISITSNDGILYYYYPITQQLLTSNEFYRAVTHIPVNESTQWTSKFVFATDTSTERTTSAYRLLRLTVPEYDGGPRDFPSLAVRQVADRDKRDGVLTSGDLALDASKGLYGIAGFSDYTPGKFYFSPVIEFQNEEELMINFKPSPTNDEGGRILQLLNAKTNEIVWSIPVKDIPNLSRDGRYLRVWPHTNGYLLVEVPNRPALVLDRQGKEIRTF